MAVRSVPPAGSYSPSGTSTGRRERSFAALYEQARKAAANDDTTAQTTDDAADTGAGTNDQNIKRIGTLQDNVNTLRGEIIVRVIQSAGQTDTQGPGTGDISRLSTRLDTLRQKLQSEQTRLSGKLVDVKV